MLHKHWSFSVSQVMTSFLASCHKPPAAAPSFLLLLYQTSFTFCFMKEGVKFCKVNAPTKMFEENPNLNFFTRHGKS